MTSEPMALTYRGARSPARSGRVSVVAVHAGGQAEPLEHVVHHSPDGFDWGYAGSGPAELALSLLAEVLGDRDELREWLRRSAGRRVPESWSLHQAFKRDHVQRIEHDGWELHRATIEAWIAAERVAAMRTAADQVSP